jgi:ATP-dependent Clp protease ATP-binding subunit ClpB
MSEFSEEHAANRLIGSPPGYVGSLEGGELTNAIRERPFSVILFDEVEKGHPRILDKFLQVLDDGRLTDGRGDTAFFTESVIIFTSNLGIYREVQEVVGGTTVTRRELAVSPASHPTRGERAEAIRHAIHDHFTLRLGRPELLNRIGEDNIVVFDFIDRETALAILDGMLRNVIARVEREHGHDLTLTNESLELLQQACLSKEVLAMGGRGIGSKLETALINPLSRLLVMSPLRGGAAAVRLSGTGGVWEAQWT